MSEHEEQKAGEVKTLTIPEWTKQDFETDKPYAWLYEQKDNPFLQQQLISKTSELAKRLKVERFITTWKKYKENQEPEQQIFGDFVTMFPDQPMQLHSGKYICDQFGIVYNGRMREEIDVCSHPIMPVKRIVNIDSNEEKLEIAYSRGGKWRSLIASKEQLASAQKVIALANNGIAVNSDNSKEIVKYITELESINYENLPEKTGIGRMGWLPDGQFSPYCKDVVYDGDNGEFRKLFESFREQGEFDKWMELTRAVRNGKSVPARIALAASFAAPIVSICYALPFFVHLWGEKGCGKTVGLMLAASVWGNPEVGEYIKTFGGTKVSHELYAAFCRNVPVLLDELQVISTRKSFDDIIYMLCEGVSKGRGEKEGGLRRQNRWKTCMITTGEMPIVQSNSGGGAAVRTIEVNYGGEPLFQDARETAMILKENYGFAGRRFVEALKVKKNVEALKVIQRRYYNELSGDIQDKQVLSASILLAADKLAEVLLFKDEKALTVKDIRPYLKSNEETDLNRYLYNHIVGFLTQHQSQFILSRDSTQQIDRDNAMGMIDGNHWYVIPRFIEDEIVSRNGNFNAFKNWCIAKGYIVDHRQEKDGKKVGNIGIKKRIGNMNNPCLDFVFSVEDEPEHQIKTETPGTVTDGYLPVDDPGMPF